MQFKQSAALLLGSFTIAMAYPSAIQAAEVEHRWRPAGPNDLRSPCPMMNSLANHGFLPRDGRNISMAQLIVALQDSINLAPAATQVVGGLALATSTTGRNDTFHLSDLDKHGAEFLEHDGSLSRNDLYFGDNHSFNWGIWSTTKAHFTNTTISVATAALARKDRIAAAAAVNPEFNMAAGDVQHSLIETALYLAVFGDKVEGNAVTKQVVTLFEQERLPYAEGFVRSNDTITTAHVLGLVNKVAASS